MNYPFDINFASAPSASDYYTFQSLTYVHNPTDQTLDLTVNGALQGGLCLDATPAQGKLTFGAEMMFTGNYASFTSNVFGLWLLNYGKGSGNYTGYTSRQETNNNYPAGNKWYLTKTNNDLTVWNSWPVRQYDAPVFLPNTWYDMKLEYDSHPYKGFGTATIKMWVNGVVIGEYQDASINAAPVIPGITLYAGKSKVRRIYGDLTPNVTAVDPVGAIESAKDFTIIDLGAKPVTFSIESAKDFVVPYQANNVDLTISGRTLDSGFNPIIENVYIFRGEDMTPIGKTTTDSEGNYEFGRLDTTKKYTVMVMREGAMKTVPAADYIGYGELAGVYRIRGENIGSVEVNVFSETTGEYLGQVMTDVNGQFRVPNVNNNHAFNLVFREPTGAWEDRVSSRRIPELTAFALTFVPSFTDNGDHIDGSLKVTNGRMPYTAIAPNLIPGVSLSVNQDEVTFEGETLMWGPYSIPITVNSVDGGTGTYIANGVAGYPRVKFDCGGTMAADMRAQIDIDDPYFFTNVKLLTHADDLTDVKQNTNWSLYNSATIDTSIKKFGGGSFKFTNANVSYALLNASTDWAFRTDDFTVEAWVYFTSFSAGANAIISTYNYNSNVNKWIFYYGNNQLIWNIPGVGTVSHAWTPSLNTWYHVAISRNYPNTRMFVNGSLLGTPISDTYDYSEGGDTLMLGAYKNSSFYSGFDGNIDEIRITKGVGRYTANFTPPVKAYPDNK